MTKLDEVIETVRGAREDGADALAAVALSFGATMALGTLRHHALRGQIAEMRAAQTAADEMVAALRHERDAALAECKAARENAADTVEVWRLRESVAALRADIARVAAERDEARSIAAMRDRALTAAVREREEFSLRLSAAERQRDEALARPTYEARTTAPTDAEIAAHSATGGFWRWARQMRLSSGELVTRDMVHGGELIAAVRDGDARLGVVRRWIPLGADGLPCAWPVEPDQGNGTPR